MKIALITTSFPRAAGDPAGHFVEAHARQLARAGHEVHVVAPIGHPLESARPLGGSSRFEGGGVTLHPAGGATLFGWPGAAARARVNPLRLVGAGTFALGATARLRSIGRVDRVIAHWIVPSGALALAAHGADAPLEVRAHGADVRLLVAMPAALRESVLTRLVARGATFVFAASELREDLLRATGGELANRIRARSEVEPAPFELPDAGEAAHAAARRARDGADALFCACGRLVASKRFDLAIDAIAQIPGARLAVVGDGPMRGDLEASARARGADVRFVGDVPRGAALAYVAASDALVHPSGVEAAPTVIREARALGVPVIACAAGDVAAWAERDPGIAVVAPSASAIARACSAAIARR